MKKLALSLLLSISIIKYCYTSSNQIITNLGPLQLITPNGSNIFAAGTVNIFGNIKIGNSESDTIIFQAKDISYPSGSSNNLLIINNTGNLLTANNNIPISCGPLTVNSLKTEGNLNAGNTTCGNLNAGQGIGENIILGNTSGLINLTSAHIINPRLNEYNFLIIDSNGNIHSALSSTAITIGDIHANNVKTEANIYCNALISNSINTKGSIHCGELIAGNNTGQCITLGNNTGNITLYSSKIIYPSSDNYNLLTIDSNGHINSAHQFIEIHVGNITAYKINATHDISTKTITSNIINANNILNCGTLVAGINTGQAIILGNNTGNITLNSAKIIHPLENNYNLLSIDSNGNINTTNSNTSITIGDLTAKSITAIDLIHCGEFISERITNNGDLTCGTLNAAIKKGESIILGNTTGSITLISSHITKPTSGLNQLYIDSEGIITTTNLSDQYKKIKTFESDQISFENINPVSYYYLNDEIIAEELLETPILKDSVIFNTNGKAIAIDYKAVFIFLNADYKKTKQKLQKLEELVAIILTMIEAKNPHNT